MIDVENQGSVRELRLARPPVNALNRAMIRSLDSALLAAEQGGVRALVISGQPGVFSAGLDVAELAELDTSGLESFVAEFFALQRRMAMSPVPIVAAITGHCPAGGAVLSLYCDLRIMARGEFRIGLNEVQVGLYPGSRIFAAFSWVIGEGRAAGLLARGAMIDAQRALDIGLVDELVEPVGVRERALEAARALAALPPVTYARTRQLVRAGLVAALDRVDPMVDGWINDETRKSFAKLLRRPE
jgi:Delta3-Delta2-enoyl-CoA isomerase